MVNTEQQMKIFRAKNQLAATRRRALIFLCLVFVLPAFMSVFAATPAQYREKIQAARDLADELNYLDEEELSPAEHSKYERELFLKLRRSLPPTERVEWKGASVETNNQWLQDKLNEFEKETADSPKRTTILTEISERLTAIAQKAGELENPPNSNRSKDEDKQKLNEILRREEYQKPERKKSLFQRIMDKISSWLNENVPRPEIPKGATGGGFQSLSLVLQILLYAAILGAAGFLIYRFAPYFIKRFQNREKGEKKERVILGERVAANESADNLFSEAERLAEQGNLRGAIRKGYVALLCELSDRKLIGLSRHKTNRDYLRDVRKRRELYENMSGLTLNYERHWYGFDAAEEKDWEEFRQGYKKAVGS